MIRKLAQCPYCGECEIALDDAPRLVFNPDAEARPPCEHLVWVDGRYSQWELTKLGVNRVIGSTEFRWDHPVFRAVDGEHPLTGYLKELVSQGKGWQLAPSGAFALQAISADEKSTGSTEKVHILWDVDGAAVFARDARALIAEACPNARRGSSRHWMFKRMTAAPDRSWFLTTELPRKMRRFLTEDHESTKDENSKGKRASTRGTKTGAFFVLSFFVLS